MRCGLFESSSQPIWNSLLEIGGLGLNPQGDQAKGDRYLVVNQTIPINIREVAQRKGDPRYAVDQLANPASIVFCPGGLYLDQGLVCGFIGTASDHADSRTLYNECSRSITGGFERGSKYWIGPEAARLARRGLRLLTTGYKEPPKYDLKLP